MPPLTDGSLPDRAREDAGEPTSQTTGGEQATTAPTGEEEFSFSLPMDRDAAGDHDEADGHAEVSEPATEAESEPASEPALPENARRYPSTIGGAFYLVVLAATVAGLVIVSTGRWRTGVHWMAGALVAAAALRSVLPSRDAGMLAVRSRWFDVTLLAGAGVALWLLADSLPDT